MKENYMKSQYIMNPLTHIGHSLKDIGKKLFTFSKMYVMTGTELISIL